MTASKKKLLFKKKSRPSSEIDSTLSPWKLLVIDDDAEIHDLTRTILNQFTFEKRGLEIISGYSGADAKELIQKHPDTAVLLLDVVMEEDHSGLHAAEFIRETLNNKTVRILLRTGQAGRFPEEKAFEQFHINDFLEKSELTSRRLKTALKVGLRNYQDLRDLEEVAQVKAEKEHIALEFEATIWQMASGVGHELGNVLMGIMGLNYRLSRLIQKPENGLNDAALPKAEKLLQKMEQQLERGQKTIATLSGLKRKKQEKTNFFIPEIIEELVEALKWRKKTEADFEVSNDSVELVSFANPDEIRQVLINLISNAVDATQGRPKSESTIKIHVSRAESGDILIAVEDNGSGIPEVDSHHIFDHFFTTKLRGEGTGLGLAVCRTLAENNGGHLKLHHTELGKGSIFHLLLPKQKEL